MDWIIQPENAFFYLLVTSDCAGNVQLGLVLVNWVNDRHSIQQIWENRRNLSAAGLLMEQERIFLFSSLVSVGVFNGCGYTADEDTE